MEPSRKPNKPVIEQTRSSPSEFVQELGRVFTVFDASTQDSGNVSYGLETAARRYFVKTAGDPADHEPYLDHQGRVDLLWNAKQLSNSCQHPALPRLRRIVESPSGPLLFYDWVEGNLLYACASPPRGSSASSSAHQRFKGLPVDEILTALDQLIDLHVQLESANWIASDFYDGSLIYDFTSRKLWVIDLDSYHQGPFTNHMGRMFGSSRFMAPEEFQRGARIDTRTTVFTLGRSLSIFLGDGILAPDRFRGTRQALSVIQHACAPAPADRFATVRALAQAWKQARRLPSAS